MKGLNEIELKNFFIVFCNWDIFFILYILNMYFNFWKLIWGKIEVCNVIVD